MNKAATKRVCLTFCAFNLVTVIAFCPACRQQEQNAKTKEKITIASSRENTGSVPCKITNVGSNAKYLLFS